MKYILYFSITLSLFTPAALKAQGEWWWVPYQYFGTVDSGPATLYGQGEYQIVSNRISNQLMNEAVFQGAIDPATSNEALDWELGKRTRVLGSANGSMWFKSTDAKPWRWFAGTGFNESFAGDFRNGLLQLYLKGNGPFENQTLKLGPSWLQYHSYQFVGFGLERQASKFTWGLSINLIKTSRYYRFYAWPSGLYTAPYGTSVEADLDFEYEAAASFQPKATAWYGTGGSVSGYLVYQSSERNMVSLQVQDLGATFFEGLRRYEMNDSQTYSGAEVENILELDEDLTTDGDLDSIEAFLGLEQSHPSGAAMLPGFIKLQYTQMIGDRVRISATMKQFIVFGLPELHLGFVFQPSRWLSIQPAVRAGGFTRVDYGLGLGLRPWPNLQLMVQAEQFENLFLPQESTGQYLFVGGRLLF